MLQKSISIFILIFVGQFIVSCLCPDNCPTPQTYSVNYTEAIVTAFDTSGFNDAIAEDSVYKNSFALIVSLTPEFELISQSYFLLKNLGFNAAKACSDCEDDFYEYSDVVSSVQLFTVDTEEGERKEVSDDFKVLNYYPEELVEIDDFFAENNWLQDRFTFQLTSFDSIPNSTKFIAEVHMTSGKSFTAETNQINFYP